MQSYDFHNEINATSAWTEQDAKAYNFITSLPIKSITTNAKDNRRYSLKDSRQYHQIGTQLQRKSDPDGKIMIE